MNLKGNRFSLGVGRVVSGLAEDGICHIFLRRAGPIAYLQFNPHERTIESVNSLVGFGDYCRIVEGAFVEYADGALSFAEKV